LASITREENELLVRTGAGTPMGEFFRRYWLPAMLSERLPEPDGAPVAVKLLGERLVAFRDTQGRVGLMQEFCPHRRVSLVYGRNEDCGLRCVFHGWKFDADGRVVETPTELNPNFGEKIRVTAYPTREAGGIVWTYMGREAEPPPFPDFHFTKLPANHVLGYHYRQECNYLQGVEADIDISHPSFLHSPIGKAPIDKSRESMAVDPRPKAFTREEPFGLQTVWGWKTPDPAKSLFWVDPFVVPCHTIVPAGRIKLRWIWHAWVPIDDEHHWLYYVHYDPDVAANEEERRKLEFEFGHDLIDPADDYRSRANLANMHFLDRERQKRENFSGIRGIAAQDIAMLQSMGPIVDRSLEQPGSRDILVLRLRRYLLDLVRRSMAGESLPGLDGTVSFPDIDSRMVIVPTGTTFQDILAHREWKWGEASLENA
jgi:phenylpropionate dioxygenase-like ring-hydroxylating dioxygenase large terminal subunit